MIVIIPLAACAIILAAPGSTATRWNDPAYIREWLVCGPFRVKAPVTERTRREAFETDVLTGHGGETGVRPFAQLREPGEGDCCLWWPVRSDTDALNFANVCNPSEETTAYAFTEVKAESGKQAYLAVGSDDAVRAWFNGKPVLDRFVLRPLTRDEDIVPVELRPGSNTVLLKVLNAAGAWSLTARILAPEQALFAASANGSTTLVESLLAAGADPNARDETLQTPLHRAAYEGFHAVASMLIVLGADPNAEAVDGSTPLEMARRAGRTEAIAAIREGGGRDPRGPVDRSSRVDTLFSRYCGERPGAAVGVVANGKLVHARGYGLARLNPRESITPKTRFWLASVSKAFTAMAIMILAEEGRLKYNDSIRTLIPEFPESGTPITIRHLLWHTADLPRDPVFAVPVSNGTVHDRYLASFAQYRNTVFHPGLRHLYSNLGYNLLGIAVERASGVSYARFLTDRILKPLSMRDTLVHEHGVWPEKARAVGHVDKGGYYIEIPLDDWNYLGGPDGIVSTVTDMAKWDQALYSERLVRQITMDKAFTEGRLQDGSGTRYGFAWYVGPSRGIYCVEHDGYNAGFPSIIKRFPGEQVTVIILANFAEFPSWDYAMKVAEIYLGDRMKPQPRP